MPQLKEATVGPHTISITSVSTDADGTFRLVYTYDGAGGLGVGFASKDDIFDRINNFIDEERALTLALMYWAARNPTLVQSAIVLGKNITIDPSAASFIRVQ